jgi:hypothetical protein
MFIRSNQIDFPEIYDSQSLSANYIVKRKNDGTVLANSIIFDNGTNVGIGTNDIGIYKFNVNGTSHFNNKLYISAPASGYLNINSYDVLSNTSDILNIGGFNTSEWQEIDLYVNANKKISITDSLFKVDSDTTINGIIQFSDNLISTASSFSIGYPTINYYDINNGTGIHSFYSGSSKKLTINTDNITSENISGGFIIKSNYLGLMNPNDEDSISIVLNSSADDTLFVMAAVTGMGVIIEAYATVGNTLYLRTENGLEAVLSAGQFHINCPLNTTNGLILPTDGYIQTENYYFKNDTVTGAVHSITNGITLKQGNYIFDKAEVAQIVSVQNYPVIIKTNNTTKFVIGNDGYIGIGDITPQAPLDIRTLSNSVSAYSHIQPKASINLLNPSSDINTGSSIIFGSYYYNDNRSMPNAAIMSRRDYGSGLNSIQAAKATLAFYTGGDSGGTAALLERMTITSQGFVGIGTVPLCQLHIKGNEVILDGSSPSYKLYDTTLPYSLLGGLSADSTGLLLQSTIGSSNKIVLTTSTDPQVTIDSAGSVLFSKNVTAMGRLFVTGASGIIFNSLDSEGILVPTLSSITVTGRYGWDEEQGLINVENNMLFNTSNKFMFRGLNGIFYNNNKIWHEDNDGSGSGLDADKLDGLDSLSFARAVPTSSQSMDTYTVPGCYEYDPAVVGAPSTAPNHRVLSLGKSSRFTQLAFQYNSTKAFFRNCEDDARPSWTEIITVDNLADKVSTHIPTRSYPKNKAGGDIDFTTNSLLSIQPTGILGYSTDSNDIKLFQASLLDVRSAVSVTTGGTVTTGNINTSGILQFTGDVYPQIRMKNSSACDICFYDIKDPDNGIYNYTLRMDSGSFNMMFSTTNTEYDPGVSKFQFNYNGTMSSAGAITAAGSRVLTISDTIYTPTITSENTSKPFMLYDAPGVFRYSNTNISCNPSAGSITATKVYSTSSKRYKNNINTIENALETVTKLRGVTFNLNTDNSKQIGLIAEEVFEVLPEVVGINNEGQPDSINYAIMVGLLVESVKELKQEIDSLKTEIKVLKGEI